MKKVIQRNIEASAGKILLKLYGNYTLRKSKLCSKTVFLPKARITMHYLEGNNDYGEETELDRPTLLFCHGITDRAKNLSSFISSLNIPSNVRILIPDAMGHGKDLKRFILKGGSSSNKKKLIPSPNTPTSMDVLNSTIELLEVLKVKRCNVFGISMGGALAYYLRYKRPDLIYKTVLVSPAINHCLGKEFVEEFQSGQKNHFCFESRQDVKVLMRDLAPYPPTSKKNPIPKFILQAIFHLKYEPKGHYRKMLESFLEDHNNDNEDFLFMRSNNDIDKNSPRLVLWPEDDYICNHKKGEDFFENSSLTTFQSILNCGHVFHDDKSRIYNVILPFLLATEYLLDFEQKDGVDGITMKSTESIQNTAESVEN